MFALFRNWVAVAAYVYVVAFGCTVSLRADSALTFPRLSFEQNTLAGIAIVNPSSQDAVVTITAYGQDGKPLAGIGFNNPIQVTVKANQCARAVGSGRLQS